jgi:hypothetical protein
MSLWNDVILAWFVAILNHSVLIRQLGASMHAYTCTADNVNSKGQRLSALNYPHDYCQHFFIRVPNVEAQKKNCTS